MLLPGLLFLIFTATSVQRKRKEAGSLPFSLRSSQKRSRRMGQMHECHFMVSRFLFTFCLKLPSLYGAYYRLCYFLRLNASLQKPDWKTVIFCSTMNGSAKVQKCLFYKFFSFEVNFEKQSFFYFKMNLM